MTSAAWARAQELSRCDELARFRRVFYAGGQRPPKPPRNPAYLTKTDLGLGLLEQFCQWHPTFEVRCVLADALYGVAAFMDQTGAVFDDVQIISLLRGNQKVRFRNRILSLEQDFTRYSRLVQG